MSISLRSVLLNILLSILFIIIFLNFQQVYENQEKILQSINDLNETIAIINVEDPIDMANLKGPRYIETKTGLKYSNIIYKNVK